VKDHLVVQLPILSHALGAIPTHRNLTFTHFALLTRPLVHICTLAHDNLVDNYSSAQQSEAVEDAGDDID
jgi:hypothetical protein